MIGNNLTYISGDMFEGCTTLISVTIGNGITRIGYAAFAGCRSLTGLYFRGDAPPWVESWAFFDVRNPTVYYLPGTANWYPRFAGLSTAPWLPQMQAAGVNSGGPTNQFGFNISWASDQTVVVEACTNPADPDWQPVQTNLLTTGSAYFSDPDWTNYPGRFYRLRSP
jgi:hypothetical protein